MRGDWWFFILFFGAALLIEPGCPQTGPNTDGGQKEAKADLPEEPGPVVAKPLDQPLASDEARAGQIKTQSELLQGPGATNKIGDWKLYNHRVAFALHGVSASRSWAGRGGHLLDASPVEKDGSAIHDSLEEMTTLFVYSGLRVIKATKIELLSAGAKGTAATIRVTAIDVGIPILDQAISSLKIGAPITIDYTLKPNASYLEITTKVGDGRIKALRMSDGLMLGSQTRAFSPLAGWRVGSLSGKQLPWIGGVSEGVSYLLSPADTTQPLTVLIQQDGILPVMGKVVPENETEGVYTRHLFVGRGAIEDVHADYRTLHKIDGMKAYQGKVNGQRDGSKVEITILDKDGNSRGHALPDAQGSFQIYAPAGNYTFHATAPGHTPVDKPTSDTQPTTLTFIKGALLKLTIKEKSIDGTPGNSIPARVEIKGPEEHRLNIIQSSHPIPLRPGDYTLTISRGLEYEFTTHTFSLASGETKEQTLFIQRAVETTGYIGGDMHLHASPSADSDLPLVQRVSSLVSEGLQFAASSDHDTSVDYMPLIKKLGLTQWCKTIVGEEVSPLQYHFNAYPIEKDPNGPLYFAIPWAVYKDNVYQSVLDAPQVWKLLRDQFKAQIVQLNHPRKKLQGYFNTIEYQPTAGVKDLKKGAFDNNWDTIELYNGSGRDIFLESMLKDWFSLLNQGINKTGVGNSDSHGSNDRPGIPRTLIASSHEIGEKIDIPEIIKSLKEGKALVYGGPFLSVKTAKGEGPGATLSGPKISLNIEVQAPGWISVSYIKIYVNGKLEQEIPVPESKDRLRFSKTIELSPAKDAWIVVMAGDEKKDMSPVYPGRMPITMINPIYIDVDGNGYKAPGLPTP